MARIPRWRVGLIVEIASLNECLAMTERLAAHRQAAGDADHLAGDELRFFTGQKGNDAGDIAWLAETLHGDRPLQGRASLSPASPEPANEANSGVSVGPGQTTLRLMPRPANSRARVFVKEMMPPLEAA